MHEGIITSSIVPFFLIITYAFFSSFKPNCVIEKSFSSIFAHIHNQNKMVHHLFEVMREHNAHANLNGGKCSIIIIDILAIVIKNKKKNAVSLIWQ